MRRSRPLVPRNGHTLHVVIVARISGCQNQKELSLEDQVDHAKQEVAELYDGPYVSHVIATKGKGERLDRPELAEVEDQINSGVPDLVIMEDVGRMVRGTAAVELWGLAVDNGIRCIAPNDGCDTAEPTWEEDLISACKDHVSHCAHTSRRIKHKQMNRFKRNGGALPLLVFGYIKPEGAKHYSELSKDETVTPYLHRGLEILGQTLSWTAVAEYLNREGIPTGPYCKNEEWDGAMVRRLFQNPILKGKPQRGARHSKKHHATGRRITEVNPDGPTYRDEPHLAHFDAAELDAVLALVEAKHKGLGRPKSSQGKSMRGSRKRTRFPGMCATCWYCGHAMVWGGNGIAGHLMCNGSRDYQCWNSFGFSGSLASQRIVDIITTELTQLAGFEDQFVALVQQATADLDLDRDSWRDLQAAEAQLQQERDNVSAAIRQAGPHSMLSEMLTDLEQRARELARKRDELESRSRRRPQLPASGAELRSQFAEVSRELAQDSFEFGGLLRSVVSEFHVYLVRLTDGGYFVPRAQIKLSLGAIVRDIERAPDLKEYLTRTFTCDLFEPPTRVRIREEAVRQSAAGIRQRDIADALGTHQATVQRALKLDRKMRERGLTSPYELVLSPPSGESNKKVRRYRHERYRFQPREGYVPPELIE